MRKTENIRWWLFIVFLIGAYLFGYSRGQGNQKLVYGDTGYPKNCRALIAENMKRYSDGEFTATEALDSIDRNCGANGYIWNER